MAALPAPVPLPYFPQRQDLPPNPFDQATETRFHDAYHQCVQNQVDAGTDEKLLVYARCLGYLILEAPDFDARHLIVEEILECKANHDEMDSLAQLYINHLFRLCELLSLISIMTFHISS